MKVKFFGKDKEVIYIASKAKIKIFLAFFLFVIAVIAGWILSTGLHFLLTNETFVSMEELFSIKLFISSITNDKRHLLLFIGFSIIGFILMLFVIFYKRSLSASRIDMLHITPDVEIPAPAGQKQHGSARFSTADEQNKIFKSVKMNFNRNELNKLVALGIEDKEQISKGQINEANCLYKTPLLKCGGVPVCIDTSRKSLCNIRFIDGDVHTAIFGATRSGKTRKFLVPAIVMQAFAGYDILASDLKGEIYAYTSSLLKRLGYTLFPLDFKKPKLSIHYNFMQFIIDAVNKNDISKATQCCWDFVEGLVGEPKSSEAPLWSNGEKSLLASAVMMVVYDNSPSGLHMQYPNATQEEINELYENQHRHYQNCRNLFYFISKMSEYDHERECILLQSVINILPSDHPSSLIMAVAESAPSKMRGSFVTSALSTLRLFTDPNIAEMTSCTDDGFLDLSIKKAIFMIIPDSIKTYYPLAALFTHQYYQFLAEEADENGGRLNRPCKFDLDEVGNFTKIPDVDIKLTVGGGRGIHFLLLLQSKEQFVEKYGKSVTSIILDNCHYLTYLKSGIDTCEFFEKKLGKYTVLSTSSSISLNDNGGLGAIVNSGSSSASTQLISRSLLTAQEVQSIRSPYILVLSDIANPSVLKLPDLSEYPFNDLLGMGREEHNTQLRKLRDRDRKEHNPQPLVLWDFRSYIEIRLQQMEQTNSITPQSEDLIAEVAAIYAEN